jgi:ATP-dependent RNA/DNA helicase IGHMBP2
MHKSPVERLLQLKKLLRIERDDDFQQFTELFSKNNIQLRKQNGVTWYPISIVSTEIGAGDYISIDVERTTNLHESHKFSGGKMVTLFSNLYSDEKPLNGTVKVLGPNKLRIALNVDELPDWCDDGKLGINLSFDEASYKEMNIALEKVINASNNRLAVIRDVIYNNRPPQFDKVDNAIEIAGLNASQNEAVRKIIAAKDIAIIHGPPGTGKTTTLVQAIKQVLGNEKQVLVCSPSNTAVDLLTEKLHREGLSVLRLGNPVRISEEVLINTVDAKMAAHASFKEIKTLRKTADEYFRMAGKYKRTLGREDREQRKLLYQEAKKIMQEVRDLEDYIYNDLFETAQIIACTPVVSSGRMMRDKQFTTVFIDEAAQALEPMTWIPISRSNRVVFAGDHFQLPPTVKSKRAEAEGLKETLFERAMEIEGVSVMLNTQYRMHQHIMDFSNHQFYNGNLLADHSVKQSLLSNLPEEFLINIPVTFIDTAGCGYNETLNPESVSISNPEEAVLLIHHLKMLLNQFQQTVKSELITVGIISPYKEQVLYIQTLIEADEELLKIPAKIVVKTVDGFQGQERDIIYISLVRSNENKEIGFLNDTRRMNVALTRAKKRLVVIGDSSTLANHPFYKSFIDYAEGIDAYVSAWEFVS